MQKEELYFLQNNLFSDYTINGFKGDSSFGADNIGEVFNSIKSIYDAPLFKKKSEAQLEADFISKVLGMLGWESIYQEVKKVSGKMEKPDFSLFLDENLKKEYENIEKDERLSTNKNIVVFCESKAYTVEIDNNRVKDNPHFQLINYLNNLNVRYGFLTNGRKWRFYDNSKKTSQKTFYEIDLEKIVLDDDVEAFKYFYFIFKKDNFSKIDKKINIEDIRKKDEEAKIDIENNLKNVIYGYDGKDSIFHKIGKAIYKADEKTSMEDIYENSIYFIFRLLFIAYFEDRYKNLLDMHKHYRKISLRHIYNLLQNEKDEDLTGYRALKELFKILNEGDVAIDMPLFNGGLFDQDKAKLLNNPKFMDNETLKFILDELFNYGDGQKSLFKRDFKALSIAHIGNIYEGILSFRFEVVQEDTYYVEYSYKDKSDIKASDGYFDKYEYDQIVKNNKILKEEFYKKGDIVLKNTSNSRKITASYYTPQSLSSFMVKKAIDNAIKNGKNILDLKILDNSCGSGHFLVNALDAIVLKSLEELDKNDNLKKEIEKESQTIKENVKKYIPKQDVDEYDVLKRLLLKKVIFGVDINPFAVELTKLSLWMDSFIFGTPLSFIEHHIKCGNALIGTTKAEFLDIVKQKGQTTLFAHNFKDKFNKLTEVYNKLNDLKDTTTEEIEESKSIYNDEILPELTLLNNALNVINLWKFKEFDKTNKDSFQPLSVDVEHIFNSTDVWLENDVNKYAKKYQFFNYEIEFAEVFSQTIDKKGFDIVIGNPPWDKTKFSDNDFFPQYVSNYRTLIESKKKEIRINLLDKEYIKEKYDNEKEMIKNQNLFLLNNYLLNKGAGDGNLFRFFVEKNLTLLNKNGTLNYVLPSALMFEDGSYNLRKEIFKKFSLNYFYSFENREKIFQDVMSQYKFALMQIEKTTFKDRQIETMFYKTNTSSLYNKDEVINYDISSIESLSPQHLSMMEVRSSRDLEILEKCYKKFSSFGSSWLDFRRELDMTNDKSIFKEEYREKYLSLYEGKMIWQFDSRFEQPKYFLDKDEFDRYLSDTEARRVVGDVYPQLNSKNTPQIKAVLKLLDLKYNPKSNKENLKQLHKFVRFDREFFRLGFRDIARDTDERTLIASLLPKDIGCGNTLNVSIPKRYYFEDGIVKIDEVSNIRLVFTLGVFNSIILDFLARQMVQIHVNKTYIMRLPFPKLSDEEIKKYHNELLQNSLKLALYNNFDDFSSLADEFCLTKKDMPLTEKQFDILKVKNDCLVLKMYDISYDELEYMLESFKVLNNKRPEYISLLKSEYRKNVDYNLKK
ncbi:MAG: restriction endonuclease [Campylobacteraceae bacterium]|jgi:type II restriction/modification system DNA methylase subunit YeeA|nr:restriction endonuclease [Campylobacteraceae bacterium]